MTQRRRLAVLAVLATAPSHTISRDRLTALLWPEADTARGRHLLADAVYIIRKALGKRALQGFGEDIRLDPATVDCDVVAFDTAMAAGDWARATELYGGPFLDGFHLSDAAELERWLDGERDRLARAYARALESAAEAAEMVGDAVGAVQWWRRLGDHEPFNGRVAVRLMRALDAAGDRGGALRHAAEYERSMKEELGAEPDEEVVGLAERIRSIGTGAAATVRSAAAGAGVKDLVTAPGLPRLGVQVDAAEEHGDRPAMGRADPYAGTPPSPERSRRASLRRVVLLGAGVLGLLVVPAVLALRLGGVPAQPPPLRTVAVAPLVDAGASAAGLGAELGQEIASNLAGIGGLTVLLPARDSAQPGPLVPAFRLGGAVRADGDSVAITVSLVDPHSGRFVWGGSFRNSRSEVSSMPGRIALAVARALRVAAPAPVRARLLRRPAATAAAYDSYLRGRYLFAMTDDSSRFAAIPLLTRATALAPDFAAAHAMLARALYFRFFVTGSKSLEAAAYVEVGRALALDPQMPDAYLVRAALVWTRANGFPHERAIEDLRRVIALDPGLADAHRRLGGVYMHVGLLDRALREFQTAVRLDPDEVDARWRIGRVYLYEQKYQEALDTWSRTPEVRDNDWERVLALWQLHRWNDARREIERLESRSPADADFESTDAVISALAGAPERARRMIALAIVHGKGNSHFHHIEYNIAVAHAALGDTTEALAWLRRTAADGLPCYPLFAHDPNLAALRASNGYRTFLREQRRAWERRRAGV